MYNNSKDWQNRGVISYDGFLENTLAYSLKKKLKDEASWKLHEESFFSQFDISWIRSGQKRVDLVDVDPALAALIRRGKEEIQSNFNSVVGDHYTVVCHKMADGQWVGPHNDSPTFDRGVLENFRLLFYVDERHVISDGGLLLLLDAIDNGNIVAGFRPVFNSAILMHLCDQSVHAVTNSKKIRYSIVVSYWGYPLIQSDTVNSLQVSRTIRMLISAGAENKNHSGTSLLYHLYGTYALLESWNLPIEVCLAGLTHSVFGRHNGVSNINIDCEELKRIIGDKATSIVQSLQHNSGYDLKGHAGIVELANEIELISEIDDCFCAQHRILDLHLPPDLVESIMNSISQRQIRIESWT